MVIEAALYPYSSTTAELDKICSSSLADRDIENLLFDGTGTQPTIGAPGLVGTISYPDTLTTTTDNTFRLTATEGTLLTVGDVLILGTGASPEKVQVLHVDRRRKQINPLTSLLTLYDSYVRVTVLRGYDGTTAVTQASGTQVRRVGGSRLYTATGSKIKPVGRHLIWLKETNSIISTNDKGFVDSVKTVCTV